MLLERWNPFNSLDDSFDSLFDIQREMNRLFDVSRNKPVRRDAVAKTIWIPAVDVHEDKDNFYLSIELPGISEKEIDIKVEGDTLTVKGERKFENEDKKENFHRIERFYGSFHRSFSLPRTADTDKIKAGCKNGVLKLTVPKKEEAKPKQITVAISDK